MNAAQAIAAMNEWGRRRTPFLFILDFDFEQPVALPLDEVDPHDIAYDFNGRTNDRAGGPPLPAVVRFAKFPVAAAEYARRFSEVAAEIRAGNTFLLNLTCPTPVETNLDLRRIFAHSRARYRLLYRDQFIVFSPETFVQIRDGKISSFPMKGTIAAVPGAAQRILADRKEMAEHCTIVDLIRNDLNMVAERVRVERFRYLDRVRTHEKTLLQVSSRITGDLPGDYHARLGEILAALLPAGSVTGAPKPKTVDIIRRVEGYRRGYYTGVCGIFDGRDLDSGVMIRFLENDGGEMSFKSGGGITCFSDCAAEYREMIDKVYVPIPGNYTRRKPAAAKSGRAPGSR